MRPVEERLRATRQQCSRALNGHGNPRPADLLALLPAAIEPDRYGVGGVVAELEQEVAELLGKPAAVFMVSGTMAQQIALRLHAERNGRRTVAFHPTSHLELHEDKAYDRLHGLHGRTVGDPRSLLTLADLQDIGEPLAALLLELPQRELGGLLPSWEDLVAQVEWARERGTAMHLDGARLWECGPFYDGQQHDGRQHAGQQEDGQRYAAIAALFDTVYVSFYKGIGGVTGSCLAGPTDLIAEAREWRHRHGGTLFAMWPYAASCLAALRLRLERVPRYVKHARVIASALGDMEGVEVVPAEPPTTMAHLYLETTEAAFAEAALRLAEDQGLWTWPGSAASDLPSRRVVELTVGDATLELEPSEVRAIVAQLIAPTEGSPG